MSDLIRKHVKPAHPDATILDPERGRKLPPEGHAVDWSPYWAGLEAREDVVVSEVMENSAAVVVTPGSTLSFTVGQGGRGGAGGAGGVVAEDAGKTPGKMPAAQEALSSDRGHLSRP